MVPKQKIVAEGYLLGNQGDTKHESFVKNYAFWIQKDRTVGRAFAFHKTNLGSILVPHMAPQAPLRKNPEEKPGVNPE